MTDAEKARELAVRYTIDVDDNGNEVYNAFTEAALVEMAKWKNKQFSDRVEMTLCIDCHEFESCDNCPKYLIKKELLGL